jgi:hypothetical protein
LKLADHLAGKRVRCPKCQQVISVPEAELPVAAAVELPAAEEPRAERDETPDDRPRRRAKKRRQVQPERTAGFYWAVSIFGALLLVVCAALAIGGWMMWRSMNSASVAKPHVADNSLVRPDKDVPQSAKATPPKEKKNPLSYKEVGVLRAFANKEWGFSMVPPKGWQPVRRTENPFLLFLGPKGAFNENCEVAKDENYDGKPIDQLAAEVKQRIPTQLKNWQFGDDQQLKIDGKDAYAIAGSFVVEDMGQSFNIVRLQYFIIRDDRTLYTITFAVLPQSFEKLRDELRKSAESARFEPPQG